MGLGAEVTKNCVFLFVSLQLLFTTTLSHEIHELSLNWFALTWHLRVSISKWMPGLDLVSNIRKYVCVQIALGQSWLTGRWGYIWSWHQKVAKAWVHWKITGMSLEPGPPATEESCVRVGRKEGRGVCQQDLSLAFQNFIWHVTQVRSAEICGLWRVFLSKSHSEP